MNDKTAIQILSELEKLTAINQGILARLNAADKSPNFRRHYWEFHDFDWGSIGAQVISKDTNGAFEVEYQGHRFDRKRGESYDQAYYIFSRPHEDWTSTNKVYYTLAKFVDYNDKKAAEQKVTYNVVPQSTATQALSEFHAEEATSQTADDPPVIAVVPVPATEPPVKAVTRQEYYGYLKTRGIRGELFHELDKTVCAQGYGAALAEAELLEVC